jgi:hypothetical protein
MGIKQCLELRREKEENRRNEETKKVGKIVVRKIKK